jgi:hypothetical protein
MRRREGVRSGDRQTYSNDRTTVSAKRTRREWNLAAAPPSRPLTGVMVTLPTSACREDPWRS